jgi:hypothetical protein
MLPAGGARRDERPPARPPGPAGPADQFSRAHLEQALIRAEASATRLAAIAGTGGTPDGR